MTSLLESPLPSHGNDATTRLLPSALIVRARQPPSPAGLMIGIDVELVPNGTMPSDTGPLVLYAFVALMVSGSPDDAGSDALKLPSELTGRFVTAAFVAVSVMVIVGEPPVTAFAAPVTMTLLP